MSVQDRLRIEDIARRLRDGSLSAATLVEQCLARIRDPEGEGGRSFLKVHDDAARAAAAHYDRLRRAGEDCPPYAGIPLAVKDNFDIAGDVTTAGSVVLRDAAPATADAPCLERLKAAGFVLIGRANMTEFAYSTMGINPHYGTPRNPHGRGAGRVPGGSSSGSAVAVAEGMAVAGLGTDTGGSCRVPAAFCGIVGFKPTSTRISKTGVFPLSPTLDAVGPLGNSVRCCAILDAVMAGDHAGLETPLPLDGLTIGIPKTVFLDGLAPEVLNAFKAAMKVVAGQGARIVEIDPPSLEDLAALNHQGGISAIESYRALGGLLAERGDQVDPRVKARILKGEGQSAADYQDLLSRRASFIERFGRDTDAVDLLAWPTTPTLAPRFADLETDAEYNRINLLTLRNTSVANILDRPAISLPLPGGGLPVGLMLTGKPNADIALLRYALSAEAALGA